MRVTSLGSGSSGNGFIVETSEVALLIDCGVAARSCQTAIRDLGVGDRLAGIVVSHEHVDHVRSIQTVTRMVGCPVITTSGTWTALRRTGVWSRFAAGQRLTESGVDIEFVGVSHDAAEPCGFVVEADGTRIAVFTDLGHVTAAVLDALRSADIIILEANYDQTMLARGAYPAHLKRRIQGPSGHLSNDDCASAIVSSISSRTRAIWLAHLSHNNNTPGAARSTVEEALLLAGYATPVHALPRSERSEITALPSRQLPLGLSVDVDQTQQSAVSFFRSPAS